MPGTAQEVTPDEKSCISCEAPFGPDDDKRFKECATCRKGDAPEETAVIPEAPPSESSIEPLSMPEDDYHPPPEEDRQRYWCGVLPKAPRVIEHFAGVDFPLDRGMRMVKEDKPTLMDHVYNGAIHRLTDRHVELIKERVAGRVVRGKRVISLKNPAHGGRRPGDVPLGCYVYMAKVNGSVDRMNGELPPPLVARK